MRWRLILPAAALLSANAPSEDELRAAAAHAPKPVTAFIERRSSCNHFLGEEPYDRERAAFLNKTIRELRCAALEKDERKLRRHYQDRPDLLKLLDDTADMYD